MQDFAGSRAGAGLLFAMVGSREFHEFRLWNQNSAADSPHSEPLRGNEGVETTLRNSQESGRTLLAVQQNVHGHWQKPN